MCLTSPVSDSKNAIPDPNSAPKVIDLFAGVGGFTLGALQAGLDVCLAVELDKHAVAAHKRNFPLMKHFQGDITALSAQVIFEKAGITKGELCGLVGGPPCQGFSAIGRRESSDPRNSLFVKFFELVGDCEPDFYIAENVLGILEKRNREMIDDAVALVSDKYKVLNPMRIKASDYGAPTSRERVFFIGYKADYFEEIGEADFALAKSDFSTTVKEALRGLPSNIEPSWQSELESWRALAPMPDTEFHRRLSKIPSGAGDPRSVQKFVEENVVSGCFGTKHSEKVAKRYDDLEYKGRDKISKSARLDPDGFCPTLRAGTDSTRGSFQAVRPIHPDLPRVITPREAARLQGFPDWFMFAPSKWHSFRQIGNSVSPFVAEALFRVIYAKRLSRK